MTATDLPPQPLTHRRVLRIALPIVLSSATAPLLGAVDVGVVGQMGLVAPTGAVGLGATILLSIYWIFGFLRMATTGLVGQAEGRGDTPEVSAYLTRALFVGLSGGLIIVMAQGALFDLALGWSPASAEVEDLTRDYLTTRIWSAPAAIAVYALTGWLIAMERTRDVLVLQLVMNGLNAGLDVLFVLELGWGVRGVALATVIAEFTALGLGLWLCRAAFAHPAWRDAARVFDRAKILRMAQVSGDILIRSAALLAIFTSFTFFSAGFSDVQLAANQVLLQFLSISAFALDGFAFAAETLVARAVGRRDVARLRRAAWLCSVWGVVAAVLLGVVFWGAGGWIIDVMTKAGDVRAEGRSYLVWVAISPLLAVGAFMFDGIFLGATRGADLRNMMLICLAIYLAAVAALMPAFGNHGLWAALAISFIARSITLALRYPALERSVSAHRD
ncbi:MATE family efflux transporter [Aliishimia ponticola]|uniref:MATE family efflux transporter n=1 Tax=Aliishimia ponticola TaxID=2499833 RepID=A0A4S4NG59_9RHOB|nr:MATE family efflux transporter [Aliishimia ponticola]THH37111.1 MATE family efflux transporter [Aliishimia ponticola]